MRQIKIPKSYTSRSSDSLEIYFQEISKESLLTIEEEVRLAKRVKEGDPRSLVQLVKANLRFVVSVAKQYQHRGLSLSDLISEGNIGLITAAKRFDVTKGFRFISYAVWWIRQSILKAIHNHAELIRVPLNKINERNKIMNANKEFEQIHERPASPEELATLLDFKPDELNYAENIPNKIVSLDAPLNDAEQGYRLLDVFNDPNAISADAEVMKESVKIDIEDALATLKPKENDVLRSFFGLDRHRAISVDEIARVYKLSKERIRQIKDTAIHKLRKRRKNLLTAMSDS